MSTQTIEQAVLEEMERRSRASFDDEVFALRNALRREQERQRASVPWPFRQPVEGPDEPLSFAFAIWASVALWALGIMAWLVFWNYLLP